MKKTLAAVGASILGLAGALGAAAAPAGAIVPTGGPCTNALTDHVVDSTPTTGNWYMSCVPQYGMGKAEFTIDAPAGTTSFPDGYSLTDGHQTVVSTPTAAQVQAYFNPFVTSNHTASNYTGPFVNLTETSSTDTSQTYGEFELTGSPQAVAFPIASVAKTTTVPAACTPESDPTATYDGVYVITYAPVTATFTEQIGSSNYTTKVTLTNPTLTLGLNFDSSGTSGFNENAALCATSSAATYFAPNNGGGSISTAVTPSVAATGTVFAADAQDDAAVWSAIATKIATNDPSNDLSTLVPVVSTNAIPSVATLGTFTVTSTPVLAETGVDTAPAGILGGSLLVAGIGIFAFGRRRRVGTHRS